VTGQNSFTIGETDFLLTGQPFRILAGALHYFRVHPDQWADRIDKARLMGLNTIETYVAWNQHAPDPGVFRTDGQHDIVRFLRLIGEAGLHAIVRPGPYICAEWTNGGLPGWLFENPDIQLRRNEPLYMNAVHGYLDHLLPLLAPLQIDTGGPIILMQIENEYGAYGSDTSYLQELVRITREHGITVPLTSVDQPTDTMLRRGTLPELHTTGSFGTRSLERLQTLRRHQSTGPLMCSEFWDGWFDHWGEHHHTTDVNTAATELDALLSAGASVNIYMFHGGTNFGFTNGANHKGIYKSHVTSYDYDAPLDEAGRPTAKYHAFKAVLARHSDVPSENPAPPLPAPTFSVRFTDYAHLTDVQDRLGTWQQHAIAPTMDALGQYHGFCLYRTGLDGRDGVLTIGEVRDRAQVSVDGRPVATLERDRNDRAVAIPAGQVLELLVEDRGRVNYGPRLGEPKGLIGPVQLDEQPLLNWDVLLLNLDSIDGRLFNDATAVNGPLVGPALIRARFEVASPTDLFLDTGHWGKGVAWINDFNLGRYWSRGPQRTLFVPAGQIRRGKNELIIFELQAMTETQAAFVAAPVLGHEEE